MVIRHHALAPLEQPTHLRQIRVLLRPVRDATAPGDRRGAGRCPDRRTPASTESTATIASWNQRSRRTDARRTVGRSEVGEAQDLIEAHRAPRQHTAPCETGDRTIAGGDHADGGGRRGRDRADAVPGPQHSTDRDSATCLPSASWSSSDTRHHTTPSRCGGRNGDGAASQRSSPSFRKSPTSPAYRSCTVVLRHLGPRAEAGTRADHCASSGFVTKVTSQGADSGELCHTPVRMMCGPTPSWSD